MILSRIQVHGFKSFAKKIELKFDGKITSVVGPNGCGKTNIVDAIRWGLGEQRASILRTDRMENVIFGGARSSKPLGMAEVSITFDNSDHILPIDYNEVVVTRRLYRSGESEYLLNKTAVRLKDIKDLLMDTGIGADAYSVIELKMVEDILSDKAEDRRKLLEEAAGVTKYKYRLRAALRKLDATQNDLLRVSDIIKEVQRNVNSLNRQVHRARRYKTLEERVKELELRRGSIIFTRLRDEIKPLREELKGLKATKEGRTTEISKEEADLEARKAELLEQEKVLVAERGKLAGLVSQIHRREGDIRVGQERIHSLKERIERGGKELEDLAKREEEQQNHLEATRRDREALQVKIASNGRIFNNKKKELEVFQQGLNLKRLDLNAKKKEIIGCLEETSRLSNEETTLRARIDNYQGQLERLDQEDGEFKRMQQQVGEKRKEVDGKGRTIGEEREKILKGLENARGQEESLRRALEKSREERYQKKSELELLDGRIAFLKNVIESGEGLTDGARKLLKDKPAGILGAVVDLIDTEAAHQAAVEAALGDAARYLLAKNTEAAYASLKSLNRSGGGKVTLICLDRVKQTLKSPDKPSLPKELNTVGWGDELVSCGAEVKPVVSYLLGDLLVVPDLKAARGIPAEILARGVRIATLSGELVTPATVQQSGDGGEYQGGMVGRQARLKEYGSQRSTLQKYLETAADKLQKDEQRLSGLTAERQKLETKLSRVEQERMEAEKEQAQVAYEDRKAEEGLERNRRERQHLLQEIEKGKEALEEIRPRVEKLTDDREKIEMATGQIQSEVDRLEEEEEALGEEVHHLNLTMVRLRGDAKNLDFDIERCQQLITEIIETRKQRREEIETAGEEIEQRRTSVRENEEALKEEYSSKESQEKHIEDKESIYQELQETVQRQEKDVRQVRRDREEAAESLHRLEMNIAELDHKATSLRERLYEEYEVDISKVAPPEEAVDLDEMEQQIESTRQRMKSLGGVNLMALEEYERENERLQFLTQQRDDLLSAEETLKETIKKINKTARERFEEIFAEVRENFQETFKRFFRGGEADLRLPPDEDPLEAQIEIIARPAGKHFRDLSLLSGGERALTAISLLFALYQVKPSPFCILDEIDAPLDDANVDRFTSVLTEFAEKTQFIIVTHNKMTMKAAKTLYGVTMEEEGVSKIVSAHFKDDEVEAEAAG